MKKINLAAGWLFVLCLPVVLLAAAIAAGANSLGLYGYAAEKYGVSQALDAAGTKLSDAELERVYGELIDYYNSGDEYVNPAVNRDGGSVALFTPEESLHFRDVKGLIRLDYWVLCGTLAYALLYAGASLARRNGRELAGRLLWGGGLTLGLVLALVLLEVLFGFSQLFYQFHLVFFSNEFWSAPGNMLLLFPEGLFIDGAIFGLIAISLAAAVLGGVGLCCLLVQRRRSAYP